MNERWDRIERLYHAARELEGDERTRFLDEACRSDAELRRQVDSLLQQFFGLHFMAEVARLIPRF
jgi:hypothetical protein